MEWRHPAGIFSSHGKRMKQFTEILVRHSGAENEKGGPAPAGTAPSDRAHCPARSIRGSPPPCFSRRRSRFHRAAPKRTRNPVQRTRIHRASAVLGEQAGSPSEPGRGQGLRVFITHRGYPRLKLILALLGFTMQPMSLVRHTRGHELEKMAVLAALVDAECPF